jgi:hypothetical protein
MLKSTDIGPGQEQYEAFKPAVRGVKKRVQYDYRHKDGELFSCVRETLRGCRTARNEWLAARN